MFLKGHGLPVILKKSQMLKGVTQPLLPGKTQISFPVLLRSRSKKSVAMLESTRAFVGTRELSTFIPWKIFSQLHN